MIDAAQALASKVVFVVVSGVVVVIVILGALARSNCMFYGSFLVTLISSSQQVKERIMQMLRRSSAHRQVNVSSLLIILSVRIKL